MALFVPAAAKEDDRLTTIHLPEGFVIEAFAEVPNARQMAWGEKGTLFVGTRRDGRVFAVTDEDGDGRGERVREVASGLRMPSGVAFRDGALYVAAVSTILRFDDIESRLDDPPAPAIVTDRLPSEGHHGWKVLEFGPGKPRARLAVDQLHSRIEDGPVKAVRSEKSEPRREPAPKQQEGIAYILEDPERLRELREQLKKRERKIGRQQRRSRGLSK